MHDEPDFDLFNPPYAVADKVLARISRRANLNDDARTAERDNARDRRAPRKSRSKVGAR